MVEVREARVADRRSCERGIWLGFFSLFFLFFSFSFPLFLVFEVVARGGAYRYGGNSGSHA